MLVYLVAVDLWRFTGVCVNNHQFVTHDFPDFYYGRSIIRTADSQEMALVNSIDDPIYEEIGTSVEDLLVAEGKQAWVGPCFHQVFGSACDPAPSGREYSFKEKPHCPVCVTTELVRYGPGEPPQIDTIELPSVTYHAWQQLSREEKYERLRLALQETKYWE